MTDERQPTAVPRILLGEDQPVIAADIAETLGDLGYKVVGVIARGEEVLRAAEETNPDLLLIDITLAGVIDSIEVTQQVYARYDIPVIYLTGYTEEHLLVRATSTPSYGYVGKIPTTLELKVAIDAALFRHAADRRLRESEKRYRAITDNANIGIFTSSLDGALLQANPAVARMAGYDTVEDFLAIRGQDLYAHVGDRQRVVNALLEKGSVQDYEILAREKDGTRRWISLNAVLQKDRVGKPESILGIAEDITGRKAAEEALKESEEKYRLIFSRERDAIALTDAETNRFLDVNESAERLWGYSRQELLCMTALDVSAEPQESKGSLLAGACDEGVAVPFRWHKRKDGTIFPVEISAGPFTWKGRPVVCSIIRDISGRVASDRALQDSQFFLRSTLDALSAHIAILDETGTILEVNEAWRCFGKRNDACLTRDGVGINYLEVCDSAHGDSSEGAALAAAMIREIMAGRSKEFRREYPCHSPYENRWFVLRATRFSLGSQVRIVLAHEDITERKMSEEALEASEKRYRALCDNAPIGIFQTNSEGQVRYVNSYMANLVGAQSPEAAVSHYTQLASQLYADSGRRDDFIRALATEGKVTDFEYEAIRTDSSHRWFSMNARVSERSHDGSFLIEGFTSDITEQRLAKEALRASEEKYRATFNNAAVGMDILDHNGRFVEVNDTLADFLGYTKEELTHLSLLDVTYPEDADSSKQFDALVQAGIGSYRLEKRYVRKDGAVVWADISVSAIRNGESKHGMTVGVIVDITSRKTSEEMGRRLTTAVEQAVEGIVITDPQGNIEYVNPAYEKITGFSREEMIGQKPTLLASEGDDSVTKRVILETLARGERWSGHLVKKRKDGGPYEEDVTVTPVTDSRGAIVNFVVVKRDVTREAALQKQLLQAQKMEALGTLAGGIAHDFNNLLQVTLGFSELLLAEKSQRDPEYADLQKIQQAARSGAELVRSLLTFSRKVEPKFMPLDLNQQVRQVEKLLGRTIPKMIDIRLELAADLHRTNADPAQIEQILMNLAVNAKDAMGEEGVLGIRTENVTLDDEYCRVHIDAEPGDYVLLSVSDTGHGMDSGTLRRIFEPFFTTKELGRGTGLGLAMVYGIVTHHRGHITCSSTVRQGTTFKMYLPAIPREPEVVAESFDEIPALGVETVLLVDDEEFVRELGERILTKNGYRVLTAANGEEAIDLYGRHSDRISLIILDLVMPLMGGKDCLRELLNIAPQARILVASGYSVDTSATECLELGARGFVPKPFRIKELLKQVRKTLDET
jgi:two-component system, cell cycle sensor histidine kinase and response regulator CckA